MARTPIDPQRATDKWGRNLKNAVPDMVAGVNAVQDSPMEKAALKADKYVAGVQAAVKKYQAGLRSVSLADWKKNTTEKMGQRLAGGVDAAMGKRAAFDTALANYINSNINAIDAMPDMSPQDSKNRMNAWFDKMSAFQYKK